MEEDDSKGGARISPVLEKDSDTREIGSLAVWSVSSAKPGNGVELLRDNNTDTYWQSDGMQPHMVSIQFQHKVNLVRLALYLDYKHDESYTPNRISVRAGTCFHDLKEIRALELEEPSGWVVIPLAPAPGVPLKVHVMQLAVTGNHQNGRDTHIRQVLLFGTRENLFNRAPGGELALTTPDAQMYACVR